MKIMKQGLIFSIAISMAFLTGCSSDLTITNGNLQMKIDSQMRVNFTSLHGETKTFYDGYYVADELIAQEFTTGKFKLKNVERTEDEHGVSYNLTGEFNEDGFKIIKHQKISINNEFPDLLLFETFYVNKGNKKATVKAWKNHNQRMKDIGSENLIWSFQPSSSNKRQDWILPVNQGFYQKNYLGMNNSDYGGGIPMVNMWRKDGGISTGLTEETLKMISMPVQWVRYNDHATSGLLFEYKNPVLFAQNDTIRTYDSFVGVHTGDFFNPLNQFSEYMQAEKGIEFPEPEPEAFEPVWCAWGYERMFTINEVIGTLDKVKEVGFTWVDVDDGFQIAEGDWKTNDRFPGGDKDMRRLTNEIHKRGLRAKLWWAPLAADPGTKLLKKYPEVLLKTDEWIPQYISWWDSYYLSPVNPVTIKHTDEVLKMFMETWNFDGLKLDGQHLNCCPPDHNPASKLDYPEQVAELLPTYFQHIYETARSYKPDAVIQNCPCGCAINFFNIPFMNQAVASDPTSSFQVRLKNKAYRAITQNLAYYADHIELSDNGDDFGTQIGIGGVIGSKFTYPKDNPHVKRSYVLTPEKEKLYKKWVGIYKDKMISKGTYLNLYDIAYDKPETHVLQKGDTMYYAFYADEWNGKIELRGLDKNKTYTVCEYTADDKRTYTIEGSDPYIKPEFIRDYLIEVY
jgi:alpha-galactosidase